MELTRKWCNIKKTTDFDERQERFWNFDRDEFRLNAFSFIMAAVDTTTNCY